MLRRALPSSLLHVALALVALLTPWRLEALDPSRPVASFGQDTWQAEDGLPQNSVLAVAQTPDGYLWLGTKAGLVRFDGIRFKLYTSRDTPGLPYDFVSSLLVARDGTLWIGLNGGGVASLSQGRFKGITIHEGLPSNNVTALAEDLDGSLWIATEGGGLVRLLGDQKRVYGTADGLPADRVLAVLTTDDAVYAGTTAGLAVLRGGHFQVVGPADGLASPTVISLARGPGRGVYVGTRDGGLDLFDGTRATRVSGLPAKLSPQTLLVDRAGALWAGTWGDGLLRVHGDEASRFDHAAGLTDDIVTALFEDREGSLWIGTDNGGLNRLRESRFTSLSRRLGLPVDVVKTVYARSRRDAFIGTFGGGLFHWNGRTLTKEPGLSSDFIRALHEDAQGRFWVGTGGGGGLNVRSGNGPFRTIPGLSDEIVNTLASTPDGTLWVGTVGGGLNAVRDGRVVAILQQKEGLPNDRIGPLVEDGAGGLWVGTLGGGLARLSKDGSVRGVPVPGLESATILAIHRDGAGDLWIGLGTGGLARLSEGRLTSFSALPGLPTVVCQILEDDAGALWLSANQGVTRVFRSDLVAFAEGRSQIVRVSTYDTADGLPSRQCSCGSQPVAYRAPDDSLWFATAKGAASYDPSRSLSALPPPPVALEDVLVDGVPLEPGKDATGAQRLVVPEGSRRSLEVRYTALSFLSPKRIRFRYRLEGFDPEWVDAGARRAAFYTNLPPRSYVFRVAAADGEGEFSATGPALSVEVPARFHETPWGWLVGISLVVALAASASRLRTRGLAKRQDELESEVASRTRELREAYETVRRSEEELRTAQDQISRLTESAGDLLERPEAWAARMSREIAAALGLARVGVFRVEGTALVPLAAEGMNAPSIDAVRGHAGLTESGGRAVLPVFGLTGEARGALVVEMPGISLGEHEKQVLSGFARHLGTALDLRELKRQLMVAETRRGLSRQELHDRGIDTIGICPRCSACWPSAVTVCPDDGGLPDGTRVLPHLVAGRFRLKRLLGEGGMGSVLRANDEKLGREVAIKIVRPDAMRSPGMRARFEREAQIVARMRHPNVVELIDTGELEDGAAFIVMELLTGRDLEHLLADAGTGSLSEVVSLITQAGAALTAAHEKGVVHRDIKPANLSLAPKDSGFHLKLLDFGLARPLSGPSEGVTQTGAIVGTPGYMSPEQIQNQPVDARSDLYSLASVAYEALTGERAIPPGRDSMATVLNILRIDPIPPSKRLPWLPATVDEAFAAALAKEPEARPASVAAWVTLVTEALRWVERPSPNVWTPYLRDQRSGLMRPISTPNDPTHRFDPGDRNDPGGFSIPPDPPREKN